MARIVLDVLGQALPLVLSLIVKLGKIDLSGWIRKVINGLMEKIRQLKEKIFNAFRRKQKKPGTKKTCVSCKGKGNGKNEKKKGRSGKSRKRLVPCGNRFTRETPVWRGDRRLEAIGKLKCETEEQSVLTTRPILLHYWCGPYQ